jgi:hydroxymethylpyrimidine/phosphomethylpyrimidine kinase
LRCADYNPVFHYTAEGDAMIANVLSIAGSDPSGGAGVQADLKTFSALGAYGLSVITALTAQNTRGVRGVKVIDASFVVDQIDAVFTDVRIDAVKIGMVATAEIAAAVADRLRHYGARNVVLDPVMVAKSGDALLSEDAVDEIRSRLAPIARVITPNLPEAARLTNGKLPLTIVDMRRAVGDLHRLGSEWVMLKGGHLQGEDSPDLLSDGRTIIELSAKRIATTNTHGTGCTLSSAIAALLPHVAVPEAVQRAKAFLTDALIASGQLEVGGGHGPVHHFHAWWTEDLR